MLLGHFSMGKVQRESIVCESKFDDPISDTLIADLWAHGVWEPQFDTIFDVCVVDTYPLLYCSCPPQAVLQSAEVEKKKEAFCCLLSMPC